MLVSHLCCYVYWNSCCKYYPCYSSELANFFGFRDHSGLELVTRTASSFMVSQVHLVYEGPDLLFVEVRSTK